MSRTRGTRGRPTGISALALLALLALGGCESFGRGVTQAVLEGQPGDEQDTRNCEIEGRPFAGVEPYLAKQDALPPFGEPVGDRPEVKVLYVHGIGTHAPGHGTALRDNLAKSLGLNVRAPRPKRIVIASPSFPKQDLGEINVTRLTDETRTRDLLFYELTWSPITQPDKDLLAFDKEQDYVLRRAGLNQAMRTFVNDVAPDPLAYAGQKREPILVSVTQSICWVVSRSWSELPELTEGQNCGADMPGVGSRAARDDFVIISHSLGSRAVLDALQRLTNLPVGTDPRLQGIADSFRQRDLQIFMLSNQLPLLEAGREGQQVVNQIGAYCGPDPSRPGRFFAKTELIAFSDPNDLMSYPIPDQFADRHIDSRLCPSVTNVTINVVSVSSLLGLGEVANPLGAHSGYAADERVGGLIAQGAGHPGVAPIVAERCTFRATDESL
ncbi:MAG: hypothetical protein AB7O95_18330, partial [Geminicoccaceae bacterium]